MLKRLIYQDIISYINNPETGNGCEVITTKEEFEEAAKTAKKPSQIKLNIKCACGKPFTAYYTQFKVNGKKQCNECGYKILGEKLTKNGYEVVEEYINGENGEGCILLTTKEEYEKQRIDNKLRPGDVQLRILCSCGKNVMIKSFYSFRKYKRCMECTSQVMNKDKSLTYIEIKDFINSSLTGNGCELLTTKEEFDKMNKNTKATAVKLKIRCACEEKFTTTFGNFKRLNKKQCNACSKTIESLKRTKTPNEFKEEIYKLVGDEFSVLEDYIDARTPIKFKHNSEKCNYHEFKKTPSNFLTGLCCPECGKGKKEHEEFVDQLNGIYGDEYIVLSKYEQSDKKILVEHNCDKCNHHQWRVLPFNLLNGSGCPKCASSKGEKRIAQYLIKNGVDYKAQYWFNDCRDKKPLKFDFAIFEQNNLKLLIEYDGELHYEPYRTGEKAKGKLLYIQKHDKMKNEYCRINKIQLLRIPYWEKENIEEILKYKLLKEAV
jgi:hypothetical protein